MSIKHDIPISIRMNTQEHEALRRISAVEGRKPPEMLRELVREAALRHGLWPVPPTVPVDQPGEQPG